MDYFINNNGVKKGPYDIISIIKQIHSGAITPETQISNSINGEFITIKALENFSEIFDNMQSFTQERSEISAKNISLGRILADGADLWSRYALSFTIVSGLILVCTFALSKALSKVAAIDSFPAIGIFITGFITSFFYLNFFGYILYSKRSQFLDLGNFFGRIRQGLPATVPLAAIVAAFISLNGISPLVGLVGVLVLLSFATLGAFAPFLIFDNNMSLGRAYKKSKTTLLTSGAETFGVVLTAVALNIIVAIVPAIFYPQLFIFGLFLSIPITMSALAYVYDEVYN